jgi:prevent-host-death family protein
MPKVGLRQLRNRLSHYVRQVRAGREIQVTNRGEVVAELVPPRSGGTGVVETVSQILRAEGLSRSASRSGASAEPVRGVERARRPFPVEPVRTLDALHLASALVASARVTDLALLSLDERVRTAGRALGLPIVPA